MSDKPVAGVVTLAAILPLCAVRVLGPAAAGAIIASFLGWLGSLDRWAILAVAAGGAALGYWLWRHRGRRLTRSRRGLGMSRAATRRRQRAGRS